MKTIVCVIAVVMTSGASSAFADNASSPKRQPNLLVIQTDEHHYNTLECYGGKIVKTPHLNWLAERGAVCTSFYATTPVCSPSRASLVSGRYPQHTDVITNNIPLNDNVVTFAEILRRKGYATGFAGKWHLAGSGKPQWAPPKKFGFEDNRFMFNRGHWKKLGDGPGGPMVAARNAQGKPSYDVTNADERSFTTDWLTDKTIEFISAHADEPFCYMVSLPDPHGPNTVRPPYDTMFDNVEIPIPGSLSKTDDQTPKWAARAPSVTEAMLRRIMPKYYGMVKCIDDNLGRIIAELRKHDLLDDTIIVFTSDHGDLCGEHSRLNKGVPYEGSARVPFVMYAPGRVNAGIRVNQALSCVDFLPTALHLMEVETAGKEQGRDASRLFKDPNAKWNDVCFLRGTGTANWLCAATDRYKLIFSNKDEPWLYDLEKDPNELENRYSSPDYREVVATLTKQLAQYAREYDDPFADQPNIRAQLRR